MPDCSRCLAPSIYVLRTTTNSSVEFSPIAYSISSMPTFSASAALDNSNDFSGPGSSGQVDSSAEKFCPAALTAYCLPALFAPFAAPRNISAEEPHYEVQSPRVA